MGLRSGNGWMSSNWAASAIRSFDRVARDSAYLQRKGEVFTNREMRIQRILLKYHRDVTFCRRQVIHRLAVDRHLAGGLAVESGNDAEGVLIYRSRMGRGRIVKLPSGTFSDTSRKTG